jgi:hypothetical protein
VDTLPLLPPGCHVQGDRTRHIEPGEALAALGVEETGGARKRGRHGPRSSPTVRARPRHGRCPRPRSVEAAPKGCLTESIAPCSASASARTASPPSTATSSAMLPYAMAQLTVRADGSAEERFHPFPFGFMDMQGHWPQQPSRSDLLALVDRASRSIEYAPLRARKRTPACSQRTHARRIAATSTPRKHPDPARYARTTSRHFRSTSKDRPAPSSPPSPPSRPLSFQTPPAPQLLEASLALLGMAWRSRGAIRRRCHKTVRPDQLPEPPPRSTSCNASEARSGALAAGGRHRRQ